MKIVTGFRGENHITSNDDQGRNQGIFGTASYVLQVGSMFAATLASSNELLIADGEAVMQGVHFRTAPGDQNSVTIENGTQGMRRCDLVVAHYSKSEETDVESVEWMVYKGTPSITAPAMPAYITGDILSGSTECDMPFYSVWLNGTTVEAVNQLFTTERSLATALELLGSASISGSGKSTVTDLLGNTAIGSIGNGSVTGAISAINNDLANSRSVQTGQLTIPSGWTAEAKWVKKVNGTVEFFAQVKGGSLTQGWNTIATFPTGFVPTASFDYIAVNNAVASGVYMAKVNSTNGTLQIYSNSAQSNGNIRAHGVFVIDP